jgi:PAS domain S-box-containing protein
MNVGSDIARAALDLVDVGVLIVGPEAVILYANTASSTLMGRTVDELVGARSLIVGDSATDTSQVDVIHESLRNGRLWIGQTTQHRPDGTTVEVELTVSSWGVIDETSTAIVVLREVLMADARDAEIALKRQHHTAVMAVMGAVRPEPTIEATTHALCSAIAAIDGIDGAMILVQVDGTEIMHVGNVGPQLPGFDVGSKVLSTNVELVMVMLAEGPWSLDFGAPETRELLGDELTDAMIIEGITATGYAALRDEDQITGVLCVASLAPDGPQQVQAMLPMLEQLAGFSSMVLAKQASLFAKRSATRHRTLDVIEGNRLWTVLQPVIDLARGHVVGYEALTRFEDGRAPDMWLEEAHAVDLGLELEEACARSAVEAARHLDPDVWLCVNFSPEAIVGGSVGRTVGDVPRRVVVEVTEHSMVQSYADIRDVLKTHPDIDVSIDDAGSGYAGLRHILELDPTFVKLDMSVVHDVDKDPSRAAMVAGLCHFARATGTRLVAEGIETQAEAEMLRSLGVELGQGFHLGPPEVPAPD